MHVRHPGAMSKPPRSRNRRQRGMSSPSHATQGSTSKRAVHEPRDGPARLVLPVTTPEPSRVQRSLLRDVRHELADLARELAKGTDDESWFLEITGEGTDICAEFLG